MEPVIFPEELGAQRIVLRRVTPEMAEDLFACVVANRDHLQGFMPWARTTQAVDDIRKYIEETTLAWEARERFVYVLDCRPTGRIIGTIAAHHLQWNHSACEIGYWISADCEGQGFVSEGLAAIEHAAFDLGFHRIQIRCRADNARSAAVALRNRYQQEGRLREAMFDEGTYYDDLVFGKLNPAHQA